MVSAATQTKTTTATPERRFQAFSILDEEPVEFVSVRCIAVVAAALETRRDCLRTGVRQDPS